MKDFTIPSGVCCPHRCPECGTQCTKKTGHAESGYDGIAGLCWCSNHKDWWLFGETTILSGRGQSAPTAPDVLTKTYLEHWTEWLIDCYKRAPLGRKR